MLVYINLLKIDLNAVAKTIKLLEDNKGINFHNLEFGKGFLGKISKF